MDQTSRIYVAGHKGLVGSAIVRRLEAAKFAHILTKTRAELDLLDQRAVNHFFASEKPEYVFLAAAKVGGAADSGRSAAYERARADQRSLRHRENRRPENGRSLSPPVRFPDDLAD